MVIVAILRVRVGYGMVKLLQLQEEARTRLGRKFIVLTGLREGGPTCCEGSQGITEFGSGDGR